MIPKQAEKMTDKPLSDKRKHFVREYCTNGHNGSEAYRIAYPGCKGGWNALASRLLANDSIKQAIIEYEAKIELENENSREYIDRQFKEVVLECRLNGDRVNLNRALENMAKNRGYYALDNEQRTEQAKLTEAQKEEAKRYAQWRLIQGLKEPDTASDGQTKRTG